MTVSRSKSNSLLVTIVLAGCAVCYVAFVFLPGQKAIGDLRAQLRDRQQMVLESEPLAYSIQAAQEELAKAQDFAQKWKDNAPSEAELADLYAQITEAAADTGLKITNFDPRPVEKMSALVTVPLHLSVAGTFRQIFDFVRRIESFSATVWLEHLDIESLEKNRTRPEEPIKAKHIWGVLPVSEDSKTLTCNLTLTIFADKGDFSD